MVRTWAPVYPPVCPGHLFHAAELECLENGCGAKLSQENTWGKQEDILNINLANESEPSKNA